MALAHYFVHQVQVYLEAAALLVVLANILVVAQIPVMLALLAPTQLVLQENLVPSALLIPILLQSALLHLIRVYIVVQLNTRTEDQAAVLAAVPGVLLVHLAVIVCLVVLVII